VGANLTQPCTSQWPGYDLSVSLKIPWVNAARYPWPRALVGLENQYCFISAPSDAEKFSVGKALPCSIDRGQHDSSDYDCGSPVGTVGEGAQVNFQLGVAWRRYTGSDPGFGLTPPFVSAINLNDRANNGGNQFIPVSPGQCVQHTYQTSSYGLPETFPPWNTACQDRTCSYADRTLSVQYSGQACDNVTCSGCVSAYSAAIQTWWWPEWTFKYDQYVCVHHTTECVPDLIGHRTCNGQVDMKEHRVCDKWGWKSVTDPWNVYDVREQGLPLPYLGSARTAYAGMNENKVIQTGFNYPPSVPVIEIQPVK
jgi:hypothetical protein